MNNIQNNYIPDDDHNLDVSKIPYGDKSLINAEIRTTYPIQIRLVSRNREPLTDWLDEARFNWHLVNLEMTISDLAERVTMAFRASEIRHKMKEGRRS